MHEEIQIDGAPTHHSVSASDGKRPGLVLIEEVWGVTEHIRSVADRFAEEGYEVLAPELLPSGMLEKLTPQMPIDLFTPGKREAIQPQLREAMQPLSQPDFARRTLEILTACVDRLLASPESNGTVVAVGFCFGGTYAFHLAAHDRRLQAIVAFYGQPPSEEEIKKIECPILAFYGEQDVNLTISLPVLKEQMEMNGKEFQAVMYRGVGHAFFNDTNSRTYHKEIANDAWQKTLAFLKVHANTTVR
jgi:carboxymethylenebutenolidase